MMESLGGSSSSTQVVDPSQVRFFVVVYLNSY